MTKQWQWCLNGVAAALLCAAHSAWARQPSLEERLERLERVYSSGTVVELLGQVTALQKELQELRGEVELQNHSLAEIKHRQRELYLDLDRRLRGMRSAGASGAPPARPPAQAPSPSVTPSSESTSAASSQPQGPTMASIDPVQEQNAYQKAFDLLKEGRYDEAIDNFRAFVAEYRGGQYADNALYWLGEAYYVTRRFEPAIQAFQNLVREHPASPKLTHALLKVGFSHDELGQKEAAQQILTELVSQHPNSTAARLARERLQQLRSESR